MVVPWCLHEEREREDLEHLGFILTRGLLQTAGTRTRAPQSANRHALREQEK